jgi:hypothetical protein
LAPNRYDMNSDAPPGGLSVPQQAMWWLRTGNLAMGAEWRRAHELCQAREGDPAHDMVHALVHRIEGDDANAGYWYRRAGRRPAETVAAEWQAMADELDG